MHDISEPGSAEKSADAPNATEVTVPPNARARANIQFAALCFSLFLAGWNDGTIGPLILRMQKVYHVGYTVISIIFLANCLGFVTGAMANMWLTVRFGFGKTIALGAALQAIGYSFQAPAPPFPVFVIGGVINGVGVALQDAQANGFVASLQSQASLRMGILHAAYGLGAFAAPLSATQFAQLPRWSFQYLVSVGLALLDFGFLVAVFRGKTQDAALAEIGQAAIEEDTSEHSQFRQVMNLKSVHLLAGFILVYVGVEVTNGGWIVSYIVNERGGGPSAGYVSSGFFGGLTLGRVGLLWVNHLVGERRVLFVYTVICIALEIVIWFVPSLVGDAVAVSFVGVLLGPFYPIAMNHAGRIIPPWLLTSSIGWIAGLGQAGSAILPFATGAIASKEGIKVLQPILVAMTALMLILWALVPSHARKID